MNYRLLAAALVCGSLFSGKSMTTPADAQTAPSEAATAFRSLAADYFEKAPRGRWLGCISTISSLRISAGPGSIVKLRLSRPMKPSLTPFPMLGWIRARRAT